jgi:RNA polymerase-binding protein DksA
MCDSTKETLEAQLQEALKELKQLDKRLEQKAEYGPGKGDPAIYEWELTLALREQAKAKVETTRRVLQKLEEGAYGICERCGAAINPERLEIVPLASLCIKCARSDQR